MGHFQEPYHIGGMVISGEEHFRVFRLLLDNVADQSGFGISFESFGKRQFDKLSEQVKKLPEDQLSPLAASTLRDYRYMYIRKSGYLFKAEEEKLNCLADYIEEGDWQTFLKKHFKTNQAHLRSFYKAANIYKALYDQEKLMPEIYTESLANLRQSPTSIEHVLNTVICQLYLNQYTEAKNLLNTVLLNQPGMGHLYHFQGISLLSGKRPFRHHKDIIERVIYHLDMAISLNPKRMDSLYLKRIIQTDYHARIGYTFTASTLPSQPADDHMIRFFAQCTGITQSEIKSILL